MTVSRIPTLKDLYNIKHHVFKFFFLDKILGLFVRYGLTPNTVTCINLIVGLMAVSYLFTDPFLFGFFYILNRILDNLDGYIAREFDLKTPLGDKLDHLGDLFVHGLFLIKSVFYFSNPWLSLFVTLLYFGEYLVLRKKNLLEYKFPSGAFALFFMFEYYQLGLLFQIVSQLVSNTVFALYMRRDINK